MPLSGAELARCTEAARQLLEALELAAYRFAVEPGETSWELRLESASSTGWRAYTIPIDHELLAATLESPKARERVLASWDGQLAACRRLAQPPSAGRDAVPPSASSH